MAKLYFRYGTVGSAKTLNLLTVAHNYRHQQKKVLLIKPRLDTRFGEDVIQSRSGLRMDADVIIESPSDLPNSLLTDISCLLVDEAQFLTPETVNRLRNITLELGIPIICYGLRSDFRTQLFPGSQRLLEVCDSVEEIKTSCACCNRKAIFNLKLRNGVAHVDGPKIDLGGDEKYLPVCSGCYISQLSQSSADAKISAEQLWSQVAAKAHAAADSAVSTNSQ